MRDGNGLERNMNLMSRKKRSPMVYVAVGTLLVVGVISIGGYYSEKSKDEESALSVNCLLYTSPSPRDKRQSRMPSSA